MCNCVNIKPQSKECYSNQVVMVSPTTEKSICIDACLVDEISFLWKCGVVTTGCCCGHNTHTPFINVQDESEIKMLSLGYEYWVNEFEVKCFNPKTKYTHESN